MNAPESSAAEFALSRLGSRGTRHRIVIVGGGAAGLELAAMLGDHAARHADHEVLLVDPSPVHVWKPLLHEVAAGTARDPETGVDFLQQARRHGFRFHVGRMELLDRRRKAVWLAPLVDADGSQIAPRRALSYDTLVLCVGSVVNDFGTPGVRQHAVTLDGSAQAQRLHALLLAACARAEVQAGGPIDVVVVGGGATGVELAAELNESVREIASYGPALAQLERAANIHVVELGPRLLPALPDAVAKQACEDLERRGVQVHVRAKVAEVRRTGVEIDGGEFIAAELTIWCAGVQGPPVARRLDALSVTPSGQIEVRPTLQSVDDDDVFAIGDCARCLVRPGGAPVPPLAQAAHQQARFLATALVSRLAGKPLPPFRYRDRGSLVSLGRNQAVGSIVERLTGRRLTLHGLVAGWTYRALQRQHLARLHGYGRMLLIVLGVWLTRRGEAPVKLH